MTKKISLYFDPYVWETLQRMISLLLVSGKPLNELPSMNDLLEFAMIFVSRIMESKPAELLALSKYTEGKGVNVIGSKKPPMRAGDKGRMAFRTSARVIDALKKIRETKATVGNVGDTPIISDSVSDAILIRSCVYYLIDSTFDSPALYYFFFNLYMSTLFDLKIPPFYLEISQEIDPENYIELLNDKEKEKIRMVLWDQSIISTLPSHPDEFSADYFRRTSIRDQRVEPDPSFQSRSFNFNYLTAMIGWMIISEFDISEVTIPDIIINFSNVYKKLEEKGPSDSAERAAEIIFSEGLDFILKMGMRIDENAHKQKTNLDRRISDKIKDEGKEQNKKSNRN